MCFDDCLCWLASQLLMLAAASVVSEQCVLYTWTLVVHFVVKNIHKWLCDTFYQLRDTLTTDEQSLINFEKQ